MCSPSLNLLIEQRRSGADSTVFSNILALRCDIFKILFKVIFTGVSVLISYVSFSTKGHGIHKQENGTP